MYSYKDSDGKTVWVEDYQYFDNPEDIYNPIWHSNIGDIPVKMMNSKHIKRCLALVQDDTSVWKDIFKKELCRRGIKVE